MPRKTKARHITFPETDPVFSDLQVIAASHNLTTLSEAVRYAAREQRKRSTRSQDKKADKILEKTATRG